MQVLIAPFFFGANSAIQESTALNLDLTITVVLFVLFIFPGALLLLLSSVRSPQRPQ